ncbi:MAG: glycosyltransferase, partial [Deltaproteobacteria bacterium]|nr:glycosyltransferase [Deltaproteobacteria bacterium]
MQGSIPGMLNEAKSMSESRGAALFSIGNYQTAAEIGRPDEWQTHAALGLLGVTDAGIRGLDRFDHEEARFYSAVASWIAGDDSAAERGLEKVNTHHAQNLLALMRLPRINVLTQILDTKTGFWGLVDGIRKDPRFLVGTIPSVPGADVHDYYSSGCVPHFYISAQAEWHHIPSNIRQLPCPIFAQTGDPDIHVQIITPWLRLFDEIITTAHDEWDDARRISKVPTSVFPKLFSLYVPQLHLDPFTPRTYDVTMTGAWFHPYQTEKARILHQLYRIKGINLFTHDGYLDTASYVRLMAKTKIIVSFSRYTGCLPSRGLESLSMGCATIIPKGNVWKFFVGEEDGVFEYDPYGDDLPETVNRILGDWDAIRDRVRLGSAKVRRDFNRKRVAGQYMRYLAFLAAKPRQRSRPPQPIPPQKRLIYWRGGFQGDFETCEARRLQLAKN